ncbi:choice-of-anchor M domain-containing protein [Leucobacter sp.]
MNRIDRRRRWAGPLRGAAIAALLALTLAPLAATPALAEDRTGTGAEVSGAAAGHDPAGSSAGAPDGASGAVEQPGSNGDAGADAAPGADGAEPAGEAAGDTESPGEPGTGTGAEPGSGTDAPDPDPVGEAAPTTAEPAAAEPAAEAAADRAETPAGASGQARAAAAPLAGQSVQPAPPSAQKRVIRNVHTDAVSAYYESGGLVLQSKADIDGELGKRLESRATLFHLVDSSASRQQVPSGTQYGFIGSPGSDFWLAPQTQNHDLIWPGFSTEDPGLRKVLEGGSLKVRLLEARGPGRAELYLQESFGPKRVFSSSARLPDWSIGVPQHTHMNWAFTRTGTYTLTFEVEASIGGRTQTARNDYTFVVGDLARHTLATTTSLAAEYREVLDGPDAGKAVLGEPVTLTATVGTADPARPAVGAVQFRDDTSGTVLGHTPLSGDGTARFRTSELPSGEHRVVAEFVPSWSNDFAASESEETVLDVSGEAKTRPRQNDTAPATDAQLGRLQSGVGVRVTSAKKTVQAGALLTARTTKQELRGDWVSVWLHAAKPVWLGWVRTTTGGDFSATVPSGTAAGEQRLVLKDREGVLIGWDALTVTKAASGGGNSSGGGGGTTTAPPPSAPRAPTQHCTPEVTLDHGHADIFNVSAGGGQAVLQIKEDVTGSQVIREAESVLLRVKEAAYGPIPAGISGAPGRGYMLPLTMDPNLLWPGWDTNRTSASGYSDVSIHITAVDGPGRVLMATQGSFGEWTPILTNGYALPGTLHEPSPAHTHAAWVFSQKGVYTLTAHAVATNPGDGRSLTTAPHTYVFQVGDVALGDVFCDVRVNPDAAAAGAAVGAAVRAAGAHAVAASQAESASRSKSGKRAGGGARAALAGDERRAAREGGAGLDALLATEMHPAAIAGIVGGGALMLGGIIGGAIWGVRRIGDIGAPGGTRA